jgi:hypothetical protein
VGVVAVSAVERFTGSDDEGLNEIASLEGNGNEMRGRVTRIRKERYGRARR